MKIEKLPSGSWRTRVMIDGVSHSITAPTKLEVRDKACALVEEKKRKEKYGCTVGEAIEQYIASKENVLSPSTLCYYRQYADTHFQMLRTIPVGKLTSMDVQQAINIESAMTTKRGTRISPKTVRNAYGLVSASIRMARPDFAPSVTLPKSVRTFRDLPDPQEVLKVIKGTNIELPCLLAMWLSLSASEIRGIKVSSIKDGVLTIDESVIRLEGEDVHKPQAKTFTRNRRISVPPYIMNLIEQTDAWKNGEGYIETRSGQALYDRLQEVTKKCNFHIRFHDLRHLFASISSQKLQIPERTIMDMGGWSTPHTMKEVYTHSFEQDRFETQKKIDDYFTGILATNLPRKTQKPQY